MLCALASWRENKSALNNPDQNNPPLLTLYERIGGEEGLARLIKWFYAKVRYEPEVEAIFKAHVHEWPEHIRTIIDFWRTMTGGPKRYAGGMGRHFRLGLTPEHFSAWLRVWDMNCNELLPEQEAREMSALAHSLGDDLQRMIARVSATRKPGQPEAE